ncbi:MAG: hypothetical protein AAB393_03805, partial [Bacteroidota bacterium]
MKMLGSVLMVGLLVCETVASAQGKKEPPRRSFSLPEDSSAQSSEAALPKIDLPEFMITGNETIDLHDFSKSSVDDQWSDEGAGREAGPGVREASGTRLGGVQKEQVSLLSLNRGFSAKVQAGYGSYVTPYLDGWFGNSFSGSDFLLKAGYKSSEGHVPNADYGSGHASLAGGTHMGGDLGFLSGSDVRAQFGLQGKSYRLYGSALPSQQRTLTSFGVNLSIGSSYNEMPYSSKFSLQSTTMEDALRTTETALGIELGLTNDVGDVSLKGEVALWRSFYSAASAAEDPFYTRFGVNAQYQLAEVIDIRGGLVFHLVRGSDTKTLGRLYPRLAVSWFADEWITLFARFEPGIQRSS